MQQIFLLFLILNLSACFSLNVPDLSLRAQTLNYECFDLINSEKFEQAQTCFEMLIDFHRPDLGYYGLGLLQLLRKNYLAAHDYYTRSYEQGNIDSLFGLAYCYENLERISAAKQVYTELVRRRPDSVQALNNMGVFFLKHAQTESESEYAKRAIKRAAILNSDLRLRNYFEYLLVRVRESEKK